MNVFKTDGCPPRVTFLGAARTVTGSMHLVESGPHRLLLDCGMARGSREEKSRSRDFPFDPESIDAVILSHAHVDHCGNLPYLVRCGFSGPIYCTPATRDLIAIMLHDSARVRESEASEAALVGRRDGREPLYSRRDVQRAIELCQPLEYGKPLDLNRDIELTFHDAGHILGSAMSFLRLHSGGREYSLTFTGDLGRRGLPFLKDPSSVPAADLVICESTYGGRTHDTLAGMAGKMAEIVTRTASRGGKILIPAFSLGRTQIVTHYLESWMAEGLIPTLPIYVDSPLAAEIAYVHEEYASQLHAAPRPDGVVKHVFGQEEAFEVSTQREPCILVASGGMCDGGRVMAHLKHHLDDPRVSVVLVSYQAPYSLGAQLMQKSPTVRFHGRTWPKWAEVEQVNGFSGHADQVDFQALLGPACGRTGRVRLVHGDVEQSEALTRTLSGMGFRDVSAPSHGEMATVA
jgi:metallo-beta-lactamase family protein